MSSMLGIGRSQYDYEQARMLQEMAAQQQRQMVQAGLAPPSSLLGTKKEVEQPNPVLLLLGDG